MAEWIKKQDSMTYCLQKTHFSFEDTHSVKEWKKIFQANGNQKKAQVAILKTK